MGKKLRVNTIYTTYQGEVNIFGIGAAVIFLRLQGCHIRCYKKTMGILCDTPEALERDESVTREVDDIITKLNRVKEETGISLVCLTGGDPLWQNKEDLHYLFARLRDNGFTVSVETSGTISVAPYLEYHNVSWVVDYKLFSAGIDVPYSEANYDLPKGSYVKFVVYDEADLEQAIKVCRDSRWNKSVNFAFGLYWGTSQITYKRLTQILHIEGVTGQNIHINFQTHKMAEFYDAHPESAVKTSVRRKI